MMRSWMNIFHGQKKYNLNVKVKYKQQNGLKRRNLVVKQPNIDFMMKMTKDYLSGKIDIIDYSLDFPYELERRYEKMHREDEDYSELIYECLYEEGVARYNELSDEEFKKLIRKQYNYIRKIAKEGFY